MNVEDLDFVKRRKNIRIIKYREQLTIVDRVVLLRMLMYEKGYTRQYALKNFKPYNIYIDEANNIVIHYTSDQIDEEELKYKTVYDFINTENMARSLLFGGTDTNQPYAIKDINNLSVEKLLQSSIPDNSIIFDILNDKEYLFHKGDKIKTAKELKETELKDILYEIPEQYMVDDYDKNCKRLINTELLKNVSNMGPKPTPITVVMNYSDIDIANSYEGKMYYCIENKSVYCYTNGELIRIETKDMDVVDHNNIIKVEKFNKTTKPHEFNKVIYLNGMFDDCKSLEEINDKKNHSNNLSKDLNGF